MIFKEEQLTYDVVIVGGGLTGLCAALASARHGAKTALIHDRPVLGGNASSEIRMHICGATANMQKPELSEGGILHELMLDNKRVNDSFNYSIWDAVLFSAAKKAKNLSLYLNTTMYSAQREGDFIHSISCYQMTTEKHLHLQAPIFADCTGNGTLGAFVGAGYHTGSEGKDAFNEPHAPKVPNQDRMGNTLLFKAANMGRPITFIPPTDIRHFTEEQLKYRKHTQDIPDEIAKNATTEELRMLFDGYCQDYGYWWIEIPGTSDDIISEYEEIRDQLVQAVYGIWNHIKNDGDHGADNYELVWVGMLPGVRESRRMDAAYMLNENDLLSGRIFEDAVAYGGWHIDNHVAGGLSAHDQMPSFVYEVPGSYTIPYRSYCAKEIRNLYIAGRSLGASKLAMASTRVMGTCAIGGQAVGTAAALCTKYGLTDIHAFAPYITQLQQTLLADDCYIPGFVNLDERDLARKAVITASSQKKGFEAVQVSKGLTREMGDESGAWHSQPIREGSQWISLKLHQPAYVECVQMIFDSDFSKEKKITLSSRRQAQQVPGIPQTLVKDYDVQLYYQNKPVQNQSFKNNHLRLVRAAFEPTLCDEVRLVVHQTNGAQEARVFEVRIYEGNDQ